ncbi:TPA: hypothetical protein ACX6RT_002070 [Photobacterium damselae]|uniref:hypothetical protein n=1 Tax=Photobacterium damselae TaxID=38293 RepID=UPI001F4801C2|nr:hypothetical protein [Photobacterium damselae]UKA09718.1 hypothetical protein IHC91_12010 [Photobacterium damselae subsp. damselae]
MLNFGPPYYTLSIVLIVVIFLFSGHEKLGDKILPHSKTVRDLLITVLCSTFPIILDSLIKAWFTEETLVSAFKGSFKSGEVFLYTSAYLSAFFVLYVKDKSKPHGFVFSLVLYASLAGALLYTFSYSGKILNLKSYAPKELLSILEISIVLSVLVVWYWSSLPTNKVVNSGSRESEKQQNDLEEKFIKKKGKSS